MEPPGVDFRASGGRFSSVRGHFLIPLWGSSSSSFSALPLSPLFFLFVLLRLCWNFGTFSRTIFGAFSGASSRPALAEIPAQTAERGRGARPRSLTRMLSGCACCAGPSCSLLILSLASGMFAMLSCYRGSLLCFCCLTLSKLTRFSFHDSQVFFSSLFWCKKRVKCQVAFSTVLGIYLGA